jgi:hypothetical protein
MSEELSYEKYDDKSLIVFGERNRFQKNINLMGGRWNSKLTCGSGWIFSLTKRKDVENWIREKSENCTTPKESSPTKNNDIIFNNFEKYL